MRFHKKRLALVLLRVIVDHNLIKLMKYFAKVKLQYLRNNC